jgi:diketogulonate reductase-like aldo/keto reductase
VIQLAKEIEKAGATIINTGIGWHEARIPTIATKVPRAAFTWVTKKLKGSVQIPLVTSNRINTPEMAEHVLAQGDADMVSMARPMLADAEFVLKAEQGRSDEINTCIGCNQACLDQIFSMQIATCLVNPRACYETELIFKESAAKKNIAVIGAGPAGLSFATYAADRGHQVTVFDAASQIGGQFNIAKTIPGKEEFYETLRYFKRKIELQPNIKLVLNHTATYEELSAENYDDIVVATGLTEHIGVSNFNIELTQQAIESIGLENIATNQIELSPYLQNHKLVDFLQAQNIDVTSYMTLAYGKVLNDPVLMHIAQQHQVSTAQISLAWALQRGFAVIPSSTKREHLMSNLKAQEIQLSTQEMMAITQLDRNQREVSPEGLAPMWD